MLHELDAERERAEPGIDDRLLEALTVSSPTAVSDRVPSSEPVWECRREGAGIAGPPPGGDPVPARSRGWGPTGLMGRWGAGPRQC